MKYKNSRGMTEVPVGKKVTSRGYKAICTAVAYDHCTDCILYGCAGCRRIACLDIERTDNQRVYFKEIENL